MRVLLDHCVDRRLSRFLDGHEVVTARRMGWDGLRNGSLVSAAEQEGFDVLVTTDKNLRYQQNLKGRRLSIITMNALFTTLAGLEPLVPTLRERLGEVEPGAFIVIDPEEQPKG